MRRFLVRQAMPLELPWLEYHADIRLKPDAVGLCALNSHGHIRGMVAFEGIRFEGGRVVCEAHQAGTPASVRALLPAAMRFVFGALWVRVLRGYVAASNARALAFNARLGFREVGRDEGRVLLELRREDAAHWLSKEAA